MTSNMMDRITKIRESLVAKDLDGILLTSGSNIRYASGFTGGIGYVLITRAACVLIVDGRYTIQAKKDAPHFDVATYKQKPLQLLREYVEAEQVPVRRLAFEQAAVSVSMHDALKQALPECELVYGGDIMQALRAIKDGGELKLIGEAARIADQTFEYILTYVKEGMSEFQIALEIERYMRFHGADGKAFDTIAVSGERSALPHGTPSDKAVCRGDLLTLDFGCEVDGYRSDMTRTIAIGELSQDKRDIYNIVLQAQQNALAACKAGAACKDVDAAARDYIAQAGYGENFGHGLGHGVGLDIHEFPNMSKNSNQQDALCCGNVVTVEPGIYVEGLGGVRIEDMVHITTQGYKNFVKSSKDLIIV